MAAPSHPPAALAAEQDAPEEIGLLGHPPGSPGLTAVFRLSLKPVRHPKEQFFRDNRLMGTLPDRPVFGRDGMALSLLIRFSAGPALDQTAYIYGVGQNQPYGPFRPGPELLALLSAHMAEAAVFRRPVDSFPVEPGRDFFQAAALAIAPVHLFYQVRGPFFCHQALYPAAPFGPVPIGRNPAGIAAALPLGLSGALHLHRDVPGIELVRQVLQVHAPVIRILVPAVKTVRHGNEPHA